MNAQPSAAAPAAQARPDTFPLPKRHRRLIACTAVAASVALGALGVGATVETVRHGVPAASAAALKW
ncbi:hypothetical protein AB0D08_03500 [Kitasatospora sp. NPDC048540]|uniref:hypothetical protein n=1 Tax=unclassified Kitasatospora TaxID=2633591 RepID=UPI0006EBA7A6|nr:hypothetical protein [Kitasatospora sp. MBT63]